MAEIFYKKLLYLVKNGAKVNVTDCYGNNPLWYAVFNANNDYRLVNKEAQNREVRLVGVSQPYAQVLVCAFNIKSIGFEWKTNETFLVTYGYEGKLDKDQNLCLDNYYHTFYYRIDEQGRIVRLRKGKIVPYKYNHSDHAYDSNPCGDPKNYVFIQL